MIPILYENNETEFNDNGLGRLSDAISCKVDEEANGAYELVMQYSITGKHFNKIQNTRIIFAQPSDGKDPQPFSIYKITKPLNGICTIYAEHLSYRMNFIPVMPFTAANCQLALQGMKTNAAEDCPFEFWTDKEIDTPYTLTEPALMRGKLGGEENSILSVYKGEYEWDRWTVKLWTHRGQDNGISIQYGKNLTSLEQEESIAETYTGVCPYWTGLDENDQDIVLYLPEHVLHSESAELYPYQRTIMLDLSDRFESMPAEDDIRSAALAYMDANDIGVPKVNVEVSFVPLWQTEEYKDISALERVNLFDTVTVEFEQLGVSAKAKVIKTKYDVLKERYISVTIGSVKSSLPDAIAQQDEEAKKNVQDTQSRMERELSQATNQLAGGLGGNIVINRDANGKPIEILAMNTQDKATAQNVVRINSAGIGFSTDGYAGTYNTVWTIDGTFNAAAINVVNLMASMFKGGVIECGGLNNTSGIFRLLDANGATIATIDNQGVIVYGADGYYVKMNAVDGFAGYDARGNKIFWADRDEFYMMKATVIGEISLCNKMRFIPITITGSNDEIVNDGIGLVSVAGLG